VSLRVDRRESQGPEQLHYDIQGTGPHVVMLHPVGLDLTCFDQLAAMLSKRFTVLRVDLRGHGRSTSTHPAHSLEEYAEDVHALLGSLNFAPAGIVGFSFGGMVAQVLALTYPEDAAALVIAACASTLSDEARRVLAERGTQAQREGMSAVLETTLQRWFSIASQERDGVRQVRECLLAADVDAWAQAWRAMAAVDTLPKLSAIRVPTLCLAGEHDVSAPPHTLEVIAQNINGARVEVVPGAPHMCFIEQPEPVGRILTDFLGNALGSRTRSGGSE
jgi:3-oxoadipate enol-lactonase